MSWKFFFCHFLLSFHVTKIAFYISKVLVKFLSHVFFFFAEKFKWIYILSEWRVCTVSCEIKKIKTIYFKNVSVEQKKTFSPHHNSKNFLTFSFKVCTVYVLNRKPNCKFLLHLKLKQLKSFYREIYKKSDFYGML